MLDPRTRYRHLQRLADDPCIDIGQFVEPRVQICGENYAAGRAGGGSNDEVMGTSASTVARGVRQKIGMMFGYQPVVRTDGHDRKDLVEERPLCRFAAGVLVEVYAGKVFGDDNRRDCDVRVVRNRGVTADSGHEHAGVENQAVHGLLSSSMDTAARARPTRSAKSSSRAVDARHRARTALSAEPVAIGTGAIDAIRRPARVTTIVSPCSTESRTAENFLDASDAVISRM